jgi:DNA-binding transcriptional LysR family regulator
VSESIRIRLQRTAIVLADELSYPRAAEKLNVASSDLRKQISGLEKQLCFHIFRPRQKRVELTEEGKLLIREFRESVVLHDRSVDRNPDKAQGQEEKIK